MAEAEAAPEENKGLKPREELPNDEDFAEAAAMVAPPAPGDVNARAANLWADPKMVALKTHMQAHRREDQRIKSLGTSASAPDLHKRSANLRRQGCAIVDRVSKKWAKEELRLPSNRPFRDSSLRQPLRSASLTQLSAGAPASLLGASDPVDPEALEAKLRKCSPLHIKHQWKESVDSAMKRLLHDIDLGHEHAEYCCNRLDSTYDWYSSLQVKESEAVPKKRSAGPSHIRYNPNAPVGPGSLRVRQAPPKAPAAKEPAPATPAPPEAEVEKGAEPKE